MIGFSSPAEYSAHVQQLIGRVAEVEEWSDMFVIKNFHIRYFHL
jgi:hypothetical protein